MGDSASKAPCTVEESPSGNGLKSVVSAPLDEFMSGDRFWELYEKQSRAGFTMPMMGKLVGAGVKSHEVKDLPDGGFEVSDLINGGFFGPGEVRLLMRHTFDKDLQEWYSHRYMESFTEENLQEKSTIKLHSSPMRVEAWSDACATRTADRGVMSIAESVTKEVLRRAGASRTSLAFTPEADSITTPGKKSCISEEIKDPLPPQMLLEHWVQYVKDGIVKSGKTEQRVEDLPHGNFVLVETFSNGSTVYEKVMVSEAEASCDTYLHEDDPKLTDVSNSESYHVRFHSDPLRVEFWREGRPGRKVSRQLLGIIQTSIDTSISEASGGSSWFG
mmetsp:Transcript_55170/g.124228  ORF Transcript_55170/g.124228 Transcript_55170/m.124228 type:complete len:331 (-) Transcript_55170:148-1140(-)